MADRVGVVLAAGFGSRLGDAAIKPLTRVAGRALIARALDTLVGAGCTRAVVVTGHAADVVRDGTLAAWDGPMELAFVFNDRFHLANGVSLLCARPFIVDTFVLTMADHVVDPALAEVARNVEPPPYGAVLLVDRDVPRVFDLDDATLVATRGDVLVDIGKTITDYDAVDTGVFVATPGLFDALERIFIERGDVSLSEGVRALAATGRMRVADVGEAWWQDVDTPEMLAHAERVLLGR